MNTDPRGYKGTIRERTRQNLIGPKNQSEDQTVLWGSARRIACPLTAFVLAS